MPNHPKIMYLPFTRCFLHPNSKKKEKSEQQKQKFIIASDIIDIEPLRNNRVQHIYNEEQKKKEHNTLM